MSPLRVEMPETWEISEMLANPKVIFANPKVNTSTFALEFAMRRRTQQQLLGLAQDAIDGLETQLEQNRRLTSIASRIKGQGTEWEDELKHRRQLRLILEIEPGVPSLMAEHWAMKDDDIKRQALRAMEALETLFSKAKAEVVRSLVYLGNKEMEEGAKKVLHEIIGDLFDYGHDMWLLRRYVDRLQHLKPSMTDKMLRQRVITEYEAGKFDRATDLMQSLIIRGKASEARSLCDGKGFDDWEYDGSFLSRLDKKLEDWDDRHDLFQTLGEGFVEAVYEGACDLCQFHISVVGEILDSSSTIPELTLLTGRQTGRLRSPLLQASFGSKSKEEILDQAHDNIKLLEVHFDQVKRLAAMMDRIKSHCGLEPGVENALMLVQRMTSILKLDRIVDECLFGDRAVDMAFAKSLDNGVYKECKGLAEDLTTLNTFILAAQVALPRALQAEIDILRRQLSIHPEDPQDAEGQGQRRYPGLGGLLSRNKALALNSLPSLGSHIGFEKPDIVICDMLDIGGDLELLRRYVEKLVHTKTDTATTALDERVVTSFIAGKFDRATSRLASRIKAQISTLEKFAAPRDTRPSDVGEEQSWDLEETIMQILADNETVGSLI
ncbi:hypothetical protein NCS55_01153600 [Fusarium keratoplasticum]|nr:hypothetical protein NCS55_01153600 [Fusarium keratoplasticum]